MKNAFFYTMVIIIAFSSMIGPFSVDTYLPSFQSIEAEFIASRVMLSETIAVFLLATAVSTLFWGALSDSIGRKRVMLISLFLYSVASLACALSTNYSEFLLSRILQGIVASGSLVAGRAMVRDLYDSNMAQRVMAYALMLFALAPAIAPVIGGFLHQLFGWRSIFYFLFLYGIIMLIATSLLLDESLKLSKRQSFHPVSVIRVYFRTIFHYKFMTIVLALALCFSGLFVYIAGAPTVIFDILSLQSTDFWVQFVPMTCGIIIGSMISGKLVKCWPQHRIINLSFIVMTTGMLLNLFQAHYLDISVFMVISPIVIYAFGVAMAMPGLGIMAIDCFPDNKGAAAAVQTFIQISFAGLVAGLMLPLVAQSILSFALLQTCLLFLSLLLWGVSHQVKNVS